MRVVSRTVGFASAVAALSLGLFTSAAAAQQQHPAGAHKHPDAAKLKNPVAAIARVDCRGQETVRCAVRVVPRDDRQGRWQGGRHC